MESKAVNNNTNQIIFERLKKGEALTFDDPDFFQLTKGAERAIGILVNMNTSKTFSDIRNHLSDLVGYQVDQSTTVYTPFSCNYGKNIKLGKQVFINQNCQMLDLGGITIEDHVMLGPRVNLLSETHPVTATSREHLITRPIHIKENAWIGASATVLPGVTIGKNSVVAAGAVVNKDVPDNTVVGGVPASIIKSI